MTGSERRVGVVGIVSGTVARIPLPAPADASAVLVRVTPSCA